MFKRVDPGRVSIDMFLVLNGVGKNPENKENPADRFLAQPFRRPILSHELGDSTEDQPFTGFIGFLKSTTILRGGFAEDSFDFGVFAFPSG